MCLRRGLGTSSVGSSCEATGGGGIGALGAEGVSSVGNPNAGAGMPVFEPREGRRVGGDGCPGTSDTPRGGDARMLTLPGGPSGWNLSRGAGGGGRGALE